MPWTKEHPPKLAKHWTDEEQQKCVTAANAVMTESGDEEQAIMACILAAGKGKVAKQRAEILGKFSALERAVLALNELGIDHDYSGVIIDRRKFADDGTHAFEAEIFAVGTWNGMRFTVDDLTKIAANFKALEPYHKVPLKFGHNSEQPLTDGQPALGWVTAVYVTESKLMAKFEHVPDVVRKAIEKKLYRKVSVELDIDVEHKGKKYDYVLSGVALLGADIPAVSVLADLDTYIGAERLAASRHSVFSAISGQGNDDEQEDTMSLTKEEVQKLIADGVTAALKPLQDLNATQAAELAQFKADDAKRKDTDKQAKVKLAREAATKILEDAVKANAITPAQRDTYARTLGIADDDRVLTINLDDVKQMIPAKKAGTEYSRETAHEGAQADNAERVHEDAGQEIVRRANFLRSQNPKLDYASAQKSVLAADPELAKEWLGTVAA